jgi:hypothetical protein
MHGYGQILRGNISMLMGEVFYITTAHTTGMENINSPVSQRKMPKDIYRFSHRME